MNSLFDSKISFYANVLDNTGTEISLRDFLFCDKYKEQIERIRSTPDEELQKKLKKQLPQATISGVFSPTRKAENLVAHSNLLCIDIDKKDNMGVEWFNDLKSEWNNVPQILYAAHSVRGEGWFAIFRIAFPDKHRAQFEALRRDFAKEGLIVDNACKDVCRLRAMSYDPEPYINESATLYTKVWKEPQHIVYVPICLQDDEMDRVEKCCRIIAGRDIDITSTYDDWIRVGSALASLGERGREYFHLVSSTNEKYQADETDKKFNNLLRNVSKISIGTFFYICSQHGVTWREDR